MYRADMNINTTEHLLSLTVQWDACLLKLSVEVYSQPGGQNYASFHFQRDVPTPHDSGTTKKMHYNEDITPPLQPWTDSQEPVYWITGTHKTVVVFHFANKAETSSNWLNYSAVPGLGMNSVNEREREKRGKKHQVSSRH